ncbi:hypothetical protein SFRURICE_014854, partial [Spodoptera frugiperda]
TYRGRQRQGLDVVGHDGGEPAGGQAQQRARQEHDAGAQLHAQLFAFLSLSKLVMKNSPALYEDLTRGPLAVYRNPTLGSLTKGVSRSTVSMLCANTSSPHSAMVWIQSRLPLKSGTRHSTKMSFGIVLPSLSTEVSTMYPSPHWLMACAVLRGSSGSSGGGRRDVFTEQNMQPRVHVSPINFNFFIMGQARHNLPHCCNSCNPGSTEDTTMKTPEH